MTWCTQTPTTIYSQVGILLSNLSQYVSNSMTFASGCKMRQTDPCPFEAYFEKHIWKPSLKAFETLECDFIFPFEEIKTSFSTAFYPVHLYRPVHSRFKMLPSQKGWRLYALFTRSRAVVNQALNLQYAIGIVESDKCINTLPALLSKKMAIQKCRLMQHYI